MEGFSRFLEVIATDLVHERMLKGLRALAQERHIKKYVVVSFDPRRRVLDGIQVVPWREFLDGLWGREWA